MLVRIAIPIIVLLSYALVGASPSFDKECLTFYTKDVCDQARVAWLPSFGNAAEWMRRQHATRISQRDGFKYGGVTPDSRTSLGFVGPEDGTFFVAASAGNPPKGRVVYDQVHRIAFYQQGCCSWFDVVAAADVNPPPRKVILRDLSSLTTVRGIRLGDSMDVVTRIYGRAKPGSIPGYPSLVVLAYTTWPPLSKRHFSSPCGQYETFVFRRNHLIYIQFGNGC